MGYVSEQDEEALMSESGSANLTFTETFKKAGFSGRVALLLSTWFGTGLLPGAPGTFGTLAALPLVIVINYLGTACAGISLIGVTILAVWSSGVSQKLMGRDDPPEVVIDEVAGFLVTIFLLPLSWLSLALGFALFRAFDILKPFPVRTIDKRVKGGVGIVLDDIMAGIYANLCVRLLLMLFGY